MPLTRRTLLKIGAAGAVNLGLTACASNTGQLAVASLKTVFNPGEHYKYGISPAEIDSLEYPALGVTIGNGVPFILILAEINGQDTLWASADHQFFWFRGPRLVRTSGLLVDLAEVSWQDKQDPVALAIARIVSPRGSSPDRAIQLMPQDANAMIRQTGFVDLAQDDSSPIDSHVTIGALKMISINGRQQLTQQVDDHWDARAWRWKTSARFWLDSRNGYAWRSVQHYAPAMEPIRFEAIKPLQFG